MYDLDEDYVVCGQNLAKLEPTCELRWVTYATPGEPPTLQQLWRASATMPDGGVWSEERWRPVPSVPWSKS